MSDNGVRIADMSRPGKPFPGAEVKIFDPRDTSTGSHGVELLDSTVVQRDRQWWMYLAGQPGGFGATDIFSASLASGGAAVSDRVEAHSRQLPAS